MRKYKNKGYNVFREGFSKKKTLDTSVVYHLEMYLKKHFYVKFKYKSFWSKAQKACKKKNKLKSKICFK